MERPDSVTEASMQPPVPEGPFLENAENTSMEPAVDTELQPPGEADTEANTSVANQVSVDKTSPGAAVAAIATPARSRKQADKSSASKKKTPPKKSNTYQRRAKDDTERKLHSVA